MVNTKTIGVMLRSIGRAMGFRDPIGTLVFGNIAALRALPVPILEDLWIRDRNIGRILLVQQQFDARVEDFYRTGRSYELNLLGLRDSKLQKIRVVEEVLVGSSHWIEILQEGNSRNLQRVVLSLPASEEFSTSDLTPPTNTAPPQTELSQLLDILAVRSAYGHDVLDIFVAEQPGPQLQEKLIELLNVWAFRNSIWREDAAHLEYFIRHSCRFWSTHLDRFVLEPDPEKHFWRVPNPAMRTLAESGGAWIIETGERDSPLPCHPFIRTVHDLKGYGAKAKLFQDTVLTALLACSFANEFHSEDREVHTLQDNDRVRERMGKIVNQVRQIYDLDRNTYPELNLERMRNILRSEICGAYFASLEQEVRRCLVPLHKDFSGVYPGVESEVGKLLKQLEESRGWKFSL